VTTLFDTHCHLNLGALADAPDAYWDAARRAGVAEAVLVGIDAASSESLVDFVGCREELHCAVGIHPNATEKATDADIETVRSLSTQEKVVAIGETGVDLYWKDAALTTQQRSLERHTALALERDLALVLHIRDAFPEAVEVLRGFSDRQPRGIVHCFTGGPNELEPFLEWGYFISFSGIVTYKSADSLREAARLVPDDRLLIETDAPYLAPAPKRGETNEPAFLVHTAKTLATVRGVSYERLAEITTTNARAVFGLDARFD
jgi:TatD DNase family protein